MPKYAYLFPLGDGIRRDKGNGRGVIAKESCGFDIPCTDIIKRLKIGYFGAAKFHIGGLLLAAFILSINGGFPRM